MSVGEDRFFRELNNAFENHAQRQEILADYKLHAYELLREAHVKEENVYDELVKRIGSPQEIAQLWEQEIAITPKKTQWLFVLCNIFLFSGGIILTISYNIFHWHWVEALWVALTQATSIIIFVYISFWGLLGYEIGKEFGHGGFKLLKKTFIISVIPNLVLMYLTIFKLIPYEWFQPLLSAPFIVVCIVCTGLLYPVSWLGYRWGRKSSV